MVRFLIATVAAALLCAAAPAPTKSADQEIRDRLDDFAASWNKHDPTDMAYFWSADGDLINPAGRKAKGLTEIQRLFQDEHNGPMKNSTFTNSKVSVRMIDPTLAMVDADVEVAGIANPDGTTVTMKPHVTSLMRKSNGKWWIVSARAFNYTPPPPPPAPKS
jgi:uncharacterized protein (TIGR02246 family)